MSAHISYSNGKKFSDTVKMLLNPNYGHYIFARDFFFVSKDLFASVAIKRNYRVGDC